MNIDYSRQKGRKIAIVEKTKTRLIDIESITYLTCSGYVTSIHLKNNEKYNVSKLLKLFENELSEIGFIRANYNTIVNLKYASKIESSLGKKIIIINNLPITISRRRVYVFRHLFNESIKK